MFDISKRGVLPTTTIDITDANGDPMFNDHQERLTITIYGPGSTQFQKAQSARNRAMMEYFRKGSKKLKDGEQRELDAEFLASCTSSFNGFGYQSYPPGHEMFKAAYLDASIGYITEQVNKELGDWSNFTSPPQTT